MGLTVSLCCQVLAWLALRAAGESASSTDSAGHSVLGLRLSAVAAGGTNWSIWCVSGFKYATMGRGITAGRGWIAVALVILGIAPRAGNWRFDLRWHACVEDTFPFGVDFSPIILSMLPYVLTLRSFIISVQARRPSPRRLGWDLPTVEER